jgi:cysteine synthase B
MTPLTIPTVRVGARSLLAGVGRTPLVDLSDLPEVPAGVRLFAKLEAANPGGSIKDRPVATMLLAALEDGSLDGGKRVLDSSSGNAGIAYAQFGAALGIPVTLVVPENASDERKARIRAHGAELILTDAVEGYDFALREARRLAAERPDLYWHADQYSNENNWRAHYDGTAPEILAQVLERTDALPDAFVSGIGTGGTITGVGRRLKETSRDVLVVALAPEPFPGIEGLKPLGEPGDIVPAVLDASLVDERAPVAVEDALRRCRELGRRGLFVGPSSGANVHVALELAARGDRRTIVTILADTGERYASTGMWNAR